MRAFGGGCMEFMGPNDQRKFIQAASKVYCWSGSAVRIETIVAKTGWSREYTKEFAKKLAEDGHIDLAWTDNGTITVIPKGVRVNPIGSFIVFMRTVLRNRRY
jgi:hypothetical protein